jgi:hypothetical protein
VSSRPSSFTLTKPGPLRIYSMTELLRLPPPEWLVENVLPAGGLIGLYGEPGSFKSFIAIDIAMSIATGLSWHGAEVRKGHVIYVAAKAGPAYRNVRQHGSSIGVSGPRMQISRG